MPQHRKAPCTKRLTDFSTVEHLYQTKMKNDFGRDELKPLSSIRRSWNKDIYECYGLFDGEKILGYAFFLRQNNSYLLDYYAVDEQHRDEGLGTLFLQQLAEQMKNADMVLCEVEDPDYAEDEQSRMERQRRLAFYLRSGYRDTAVRALLFGVRYQILEGPDADIHSAEEIQEVYTAMYRSLLPWLIFRMNLHVQIRNT